MTNTIDSGVLEMFFSTKKRLNRLRYLKRTLVLLIPTSILAAIFDLGWLTADSSPEILVLTGILMFAIIASNIMLQIRRLHDLNLTGWIVLVSFIPIVGSLFELFLLLKKGTEGENKYGSDPLME